MDETYDEMDRSDTAGSAGTPDAQWTASSLERSFETPEPVSLNVQNASGEVVVEVHGEARTEIMLIALDRAGDELVRGARIRERAVGGRHEVSVEIPRLRALAKLWSVFPSGVRVLVKVPAGTVLNVTTASASLTARGRYQEAVVRSASGGIAIDHVSGTVRIRTASGLVDLGTVGDELDVQSASGDVRIASAEAGANVSTASGDVALGRVGRLTRVRAASGDVRLGEVLEGADIETVSGDQRVERAAAGEFVMRAVSGDIAVAVVPGSLVHFDAGSMSGQVGSEIDLAASRPADAAMKEGVRELSIRAKTVSGDISVARAAS